MENPTDRGTCRLQSVGHKESDMIEVTRKTFPGLETGKRLGKNLRTHQRNRGRIYSCDFSKLNASREFPGFDLVLLLSWPGFKP